MATKSFRACSKCNSRRLVSLCDGCQKLFCQNHANEHRHELNEELKKLCEQHHRFDSIFEQHEKNDEHPLFSQIEVWELENIKKIRWAADKARKALRISLDEAKQRMKIILDKFKNELQTAEVEDHFTEIDLNSWKDELIKIKNQMETPMDIELIEDTKTTAIHCIKIQTKNKSSGHSVVPVIGIAESKVSVEVTEKPMEIKLEVASPIEKPVEAELEVALPIEECKPVESKEEPVESVTTDSLFLLEPKKNKILLFYDHQVDSPSDFSLVLKRFAGDSLQIFNHSEEMDKALEDIEQASLILYLTIEESNEMLDKYAQTDRIHSVYIRDEYPQTREEIDHLMRRCPKIRGIVRSDLSLVSRWVMDTAGDYRMHADSWLARGDRDRAKDCFQYSYRFFQILSKFLKEQR